jgi:septum formation protein
MIILASKSAARAALLRGAGVSFEMWGSGVDEEPLKQAWLTEGRTPATVAEGLAAAKALKVSAEQSGALVIGADQTLEFQGELFDKPADRWEARQRLLEFRGGAHTLHSAVVLARAGELVWRATESAVMHVRGFSDAWLDAYLAQVSDDVLDSVGGYQLEGAGVQLFERIEGDWFAILGLPMLGLLAALRREGALLA